MTYEDEPLVPEIQKYPFGDMGREVGGYAGDIAEVLDTPPLGESDPSDYHLLGTFLEFEICLDLMPMDEEVWPDFHVDVVRTLATLHAALPFTEAERCWLLQLYRDDTRDYRVDSPDPPVDPSAEAVVLSAGVRTAIRAEELLRRWSAWRRQTGEFEGQDSVTVAGEALRTLAGQMAEGPRIGPEHQTVMYERMIAEIHADYQRLLAPFMGELPPRPSHVLPTRRPRRLREDREHE